MFTPPGTPGVGGNLKLAGFRENNVATNYVSPTYPIFNTIMFLTPADQFDRMESNGSVATGSGVTVYAAGVGEEISVYTHGGLDGARVEDFSHYISFILDRIGGAHLV